MCARSQLTPTLHTQHTQALSAPTCHCLRNGKWGPLLVKELVPGDIIGLKGGDVIPADSKVGVMLQC